MSGPAISTADPPSEGEESAATARTHRLTPPLEFAPLPVGALLDDRRYEIISCLEQGPTQNVYLARDRQHRLCRRCGFSLNELDAHFCESCGRRLTGSPAEHPAFRLAESQDAKAFEAGTLLARASAWHPHLVNVLRAFEYTPYGSRPRYYLVSERAEGESLASLPKPPSSERIFAWGKELAEALAYLHGQGICHGHVRAENVLRIGDHVKLAGLDKASLVAAEQDGKERCGGDVMALLGLLRDLLAEQKLPTRVAAVANRALTPPGAETLTTAQLARRLQLTLEALRRPPALAFAVGYLSDTGRVRSSNEDAVLTLELGRLRQAASQPLGLYAVADGMGGHDAGEVASSLAIDALARAILNKLLLPALDAATSKVAYGAVLEEAFREANRAVYEERRRRQSDSGTTLVAALLAGSDAYVANVGDSRAYKIGAGTIQRITRDHSLVEEMVTSGSLTREAAQHHPGRNVITRSIGDQPAVEIDSFHVQLDVGEWLLLCSDGLYDLVEDAQLQAVVTTSAHPQQACDALVRLANERGGHDNISLVLVQVQEIGGGALGEEMICPTCGTASRTGAHFCTYCGAALATPTPSSAISTPSRGEEARLSAEPATAVQAGLRPASGLALQVGYGSHSGRRELNEDSLCALTLANVSESKIAPSLGLFLVADGMGGHQAGEVASKLAVQTVATRLLEKVLLPASSGEPLAAEAVRESVLQAIQAANEQILERARESASDLGCTLTLALVLDGRAYIANVGDSRTYIYGQGGLRQVTADHSLVASLIAAGLAQPGDEYTHPQRSVITRAVGLRPQVEIDLWEKQLSPGEVLLLCCDGLWEALRNEGIAEVLRANADPQSTCDELIRRALANGGDDNITAIVVKVGS